MIAVALGLIVLVAWIGIAVSLIVFPLRWLRSNDPAADAFLRAMALLAITAGVAALLLLVGLATGDLDFKSSLLPDGCYRVGHEIVGKTTRNTFELINTCR